MSGAIDAPFFTLFFTKIAFYAIDVVTTKT